MKNNFQNMVQEIAIQSGWGQGTSSDDCPTCSPFDIDLFSKLLVRKCADTIDDHTNRSLHNGDVVSTVSGRDLIRYILLASANRDDRIKELHARDVELNKLLEQGNNTRKLMSEKIAVHSELIKLYQEELDDQDE